MTPVPKIRPWPAAWSSSTTLPRSSRPGHPPPAQARPAARVVAAPDYTRAVAGQAVLAVYCGTRINRTGAIPALDQSEIDVFVYYGFSDLDILGGGITITGSSRATTAW